MILDGENRGSSSFVLVSWEGSRSWGGTSSNDGGGVVREGGGDASRGSVGGCFGEEMLVAWDENESKVNW